MLKAVKAILHVILLHYDKFLVLPPFTGRSGLIDLTLLFLNFHISTNYSSFVLLTVIIRFVINTGARIKTRASTFIAVYQLEYSIS